MQPTNARASRSACPSRARGSSCPSGGVDYELACPIVGYIVAGTDARVAAKDVDVSFRGEAGSPVAPGVTTHRSVVFHAVRTRAGAGSTSFQPFIGCIPSRGGGGRALTGLTAPAAGFKPVAALRSVVVDNPVRRRLPTVRVGAPPERGSSAPPTRSASGRRCRRSGPLGAVRVRRIVVEGVVVARVTTPRLLGAQAEVQVRAVCVRA